MPYQYNTLVFDSGFGNIDMGNTQANGFAWYLEQWFNTQATDPSNVNVANGILTLGGGASGTVAQLECALKNGSGGYVGQVFANGAYFEMIAGFDDTLGTVASAYPAFWLEPLEHILQNGSDQWPKQKAGYAHFGEIDIMEFYHTPYQDTTGVPAYLASVHDWSGVWNTGYPINIVHAGTLTPTVQPVDWKAQNKYGLLWTPQNGTTPGSLAYYFNDALGYINYYKGPVGNPPLSGQGPAWELGHWFAPTPSQASRTYAIVDAQRWVMRVETDPLWPMTISSIKVWQA